MRVNATPSSVWNGDNSEDCSFVGRSDCAGVGAALGISGDVGDAEQAAPCDNPTIGLMGQDVSANWIAATAAESADDINL